MKVRGKITRPSILESLMQIKDYSIHENDVENLQRFDETLSKLNDTNEQDFLVKLALKKERVDYTKIAYQNAKYSYSSSLNIYKQLAENFRNDQLNLLKLGYSWKHCKRKSQVC